MTVALATLFYGGLFVSVEALARRLGMAAESSRKVVHIVAGVVGALLPLALSFGQIRLLCIIFVPVMILSKRLRVFSSIHNVKRVTYGEVYFPLGILAVATFFPVAEVYVFAVLVMALGDGLASVVGQKYGRKEYHLGAAQKSYAGSATMFGVVSIVGGAILLTSGAHLVAGVSYAVWLAGLLTAAEAISPYGLDNLLLPPLAGYLMTIALAAT